MTERRFAPLLVRVFCLALAATSLAGCVIEPVGYRPYPRYGYWVR